MLTSATRRSIDRVFPPLTGPLVLLGIGAGLVVADDVLGGGYVPADTVLKVFGMDKAVALDAVAKGALAGWLAAVLIHRFVHQEP